MTVEEGKLIELLNEYAKQSYDDYSFFKYMEPTHSFYVVDDGYESYMPEETILSKRFGFISWLVENDKINLWEKLFNLTKNDNRKSIICDLDNNDFSWEDTFLMLLSISNSPIDDLVLYLK